MKYKKIRVSSNSNPIQYKLRSPLKVSNITIRNCIIPNTSYLINSFNNKFYYDNNIVILNVGNYSSQTLLTELNNKLNPDITINYNTNQYKYTFTSNSTITIKWSSMKSLSNILGNRVLANNGMDETNTSFISTDAINLSIPYYSIFISDLSNIDENPLYAYDIIYNNVSGGNILYFNREKFEFDEVLYNDKSLTNLNIEIRDHNNEKIYFNGANLLFEFDVFYQ